MNWLPWVVLCSLLLGTPKEEFAALEERMETAHELHVGRTESGEETESAKGASDPRLEILIRMDALADSTASNPEGGTFALRTFWWSEQLHLDEPKLLDRFELLVEHHASHESLSDALSSLPALATRVATPRDWLKKLEVVARTTTRKQNKIAALSASGLILLNTGEPLRSRAAFQSVIDGGAESEEAKVARGYIFEIDHLQIGMAAPDFSVRTLAGESLTLKSLRGKIVLLDFWASWCGPCLMETPHLKAAAERFARKSFMILGISLDDFKEMAAGTVEQRGMPGVHAWDEKGRENPVGELYNVQDLPRWFLLDAQGIIRARNCFGEALIPAVEKLIEKSGEKTGQP